MTIGATSLGFGSTPLAELLEQLHELGGDCLELNSQPGLHGGLELDAGSAPQVLRWAADAGITISSVAGYNDFAQPDEQALAAEVTRLLRACELAHDLGVGLVRAFTGEPKPELGAQPARAAVVEGLRRAAAAAAPLGVTLAVENHGHLINDGVELAELVTEVGAPNVGLTLDSGNFSWAGHDLDRTRADFAAALPRAVSVHVKDGVWTDGGFEFVPAGQGALPIAQLLDDLRSRSYDGPVYSEYEGSGEFLGGTRESIDFLRGVVAP